MQPEQPKIIFGNDESKTLVENTFPKTNTLYLDLLYNNDVTRDGQVLTEPDKKNTEPEIVETEKSPDPVSPEKKITEPSITPKIKPNLLFKKKETQKSETIPNESLFVSSDEEDFVTEPANFIDPYTTRSRSSSIVSSGFEKSNTEDFKQHDRDKVDELSKKTIFVKRLADIHQPQETPKKRKRKVKDKKVETEPELEIQPQPPQEPEPNETEKIAELIFQHEILRKMYPDANIPPVNRFAPLSEIQHEYDLISKKLEMATTIDKSKKVFVMGLLGLELMLGKLGLDMAGFTVDQLNNMESYNDVLYELGKKYSIIAKAQVQPELKLMFLVVFSVVTHLVSRTLEASGAEAVAGIVQQSTKHTFKNMF